MGKKFPFSGADSLCINRTDDALAAKLISGLAHHIRIGNRSRIETYFICASQQKGAHIIHRSNTTADGQRDVALLCRSAHHVKHRAAVFMRCMYIKETDFISASRIIGARGIHRIPRVAQIHEIHPFHDPPIGHIKTGYDTCFKHSTHPKLRADQLRRHKVRDQK